VVADSLDSGKSVVFKAYSLSELFESRGVTGGVLNVAVAEIILNEPGIRPVVGQGEAAGMAQHVKMGGPEDGREALYLRRARLTVDRWSGVRC